MALLVKGERRDGTAIVARIADEPGGDVAQRLYEDGWRWAVIRDQQGNYVGRVGKNDESVRTWWGDDAA